MVPAINVRMNIGGNGTGSVFFDVSGVPQQPACNGNGASTVICTFALPTVPAGQRGVFRSVSGPGSVFTGFSGACSEQGAPPFVTCTFRGVGFARDVFGQFLR